MSAGLILLALLMGAVTYPSRALPLLVPGIERLPRRALDFLALVGPAVLAALAAVNVMVVTSGGRPGFHIGVEWLAVAVSIVVMARTRNLFGGLVLGVVLVAGARASGLA